MVETSTSTLAEIEANIQNGINVFFISNPTIHSSSFIVSLNDNIPITSTNIMNITSYYQNQNYAMVPFRTCFGLSNVYRTTNVVPVVATTNNNNNNNNNGNGKDSTTSSSISIFGSYSNLLATLLAGAGFVVLAL